MNASTLTARAKSFIIGNAEMAERIRVHNWEAAPLGPIEDWSETLVATVNLMLHSPFPNDPLVSTVIRSLFFVQPIRGMPFDGNTH
jgi:hypothetical protein